MKEGDQQFLPARHQSDLEGASTDDAGSQRPPPSSPTSRDKHDKDLPMEAGKDRGRVYLACRQWCAISSYAMLLFVTLF